MRPLEFPLLTDENIRHDVVVGLVAQGKDVRTVHDEGLTGAADLDILRRARALGRVVVTHDADFGRLAVQDGEPVVGIIYVRPGHFSAVFVLETLAAIETRDDDVEPAVPVS